MRALLILAAASSLGAVAWAQSGHPVSAGVYTTAQAARGATAYAQHCAGCHGAGMEGVDVAPPLAGGRFLANWTNQPLGALFTKIKTTMPQDDPGSLGGAQTADIVAAMLQANGFAPGKDDLPADADQLQQVTIDAPKPVRH